MFRSQSISDPSRDDWGSSTIMLSSGCGFQWEEGKGPPLPSLPMLSMLVLDPNDLDWARWPCILSDVTPKPGLDVGVLANAIVQATSTVQT